MVGMQRSAPGCGGRGRGAEVRRGRTDGEWGGELEGRASAGPREGGRWTKSGNGMDLGRERHGDGGPYMSREAPDLLKSPKQLPHENQ